MILRYVALRHVTLLLIVLCYLALHCVMLRYVNDQSQLTNEATCFLQHPSKTDQSVSTNQTYYIRVINNISLDSVAEVFGTSVALTENSSFQNYTQPDDHTMFHATNLNHICNFLSFKLH